MKLILTRSFTHPLDLIVLKRSLMALGIPEEKLDTTWDTLEIESEYDIKVMLVEDYLSSPEIQAKVIAHLQEHHDKSN